jgi:DNA/RNA endonuclease G (NUC1)
MVEVGVLKEQAVRLKEQAVVLNKNLEMMKITVEELERKTKVQLVTDAHDAVRIYNRAG